MPEPNVVLHPVLSSQMDACVQPLRDSVALLRNLLARVMYFLGRSLGRHERAAARERALALDVVALNERLRTDALHDPLTTLANRVLLGEQTDAALSRMLLGDPPPALILLDLDRFKTINDSLGHATGDDVLVEVARRILGASAGIEAGAPLVVARLGGDEFAVLLSGIPNSGAAATGLADRLLDCLRLPITVRGREVFVAASIGVAIGDTHTTSLDLLREADTAMYAAKRAGAGCVRTFEPALGTEAMRRLDMEGDLRRGLAQHQFVVHFQPIAELKSGRVRSFEALVRWHHPLHGLLGPGEFVLHAEETGLIVPLGRWVLQQACQQLRAWQSRWPSNPPLSVSVNLAQRQLLEPDLVEQVRKALAAADLAPASLMLEITESGLVDASEHVINRLEMLRQMGVRIALDDFGTGYSSLSYLRYLPLDAVKIDRSFVADIDHDPKQAALVRAIVTLCHTLELQTVAEGIEHASQASRLVELGCDQGQGYYLARPFDPTTLDASLAVQLFGGLPMLRAA